MALADSTLDRAHKRLPPGTLGKETSEIAGLSPAAQSNLGFGLTVPAAPGTRGERISDGRFRGLRVSSRSRLAKVAADKHFADATLSQWW